MSQDKKDKYYELRLLIVEALDGTISSDRVAALEEVLKNNPDSRRYYIEYLDTHASLRNLFSPVQSDITETADDVLDASLWQALAEDEKTAPSVTVEPPRELESFPVKMVKVEKTPRTINKFSLYTAIISTAALVFLLITIRLIPQEPPVVATLIESVDAEWADSDSLSEKGDALRVGSLSLKRGIVEMAFFDGSVVTVEGPSQLSLESSDQMYLEKGKLWAKCEYQPGFTVRTPNATVVDYGTEFGLAVDDSGRTRTYVSEGQVDLRLGSDMKVYEQSRRLVKGQAAGVRNGRIESINADQASFVHSIGAVKKARSMFGENLIVNGDFEQDAGRVSVAQLQQNMQISGWEDNSPALVADYNLLGTHPYTLSGRANDVSDISQFVLPPNRGNNFFHSHHNSTVSQAVDVSDLFYDVDQGVVQYELSGWLGGYADQDNPIELKLKFMSAGGEILGQSQIGPVSPAERNNLTGFVKKQKSGLLPASCRIIQVELQGRKRLVQEGADAYADNLDLSLSLK
ncbi:MAG: FecR family protein [Planctomycetota bacterium]